MPNPPEAARHHNSRKLPTLLPFRAIQNNSFQNETPCTSKSSSKNLSNENCALKRADFDITYQTLILGPGTQIDGWLVWAITHSDFGRSGNPISTRGGICIVPPHYYLPTQLQVASYGTTYQLMDDYVIKRCYQRFVSYPKLLIIQPKFVI